jgi:hypothetical protein
MRSLFAPGRICGENVIDLELKANRLYQFQNPITSRILVLPIHRVDRGGPAKAAGR